MSKEKLYAPNELHINEEKLYVVRNAITGGRLIEYRSIEEAQAFMTGYRSGYFARESEYYESADEHDPNKSAD